MKITSSDRKNILDKLETIVSNGGGGHKSLLTRLDLEKIQHLFSTKIGLNFERITDDVYQKHLDSGKYVFLEKHSKCDHFSASQPKTFGSVIQGDNLPALFLLQNIYQQEQKKVNLIYIDPPYNTGSTGFIYNNDYRVKGSDKGLCQVQVDDNFRHSKWLSIMETRLLYAKKLLRDDGLIAISIDDNELYHLKLLMDQIFGSDCYKGTIIWKRSPGMVVKKNIRRGHEYVLIYEKSFGLSKFNFSKNNCSEKIRTLINRGSLGAPNRNSSLWYPIINPKTKKEVWPFNGRGNKKIWLISQERYRKELQENNIVWKRVKIKNEVVEMPHVKREVCKHDDLFSVIDTDGVSRSGSNSGTDDLTKDFDGNSDLFTFPKPINFIKHLIKYMAPKDGLILDFFAGSGTTACAVAQLNKEDGGNRQFVLVTNNDGDDIKRIKNNKDYCVFENVLYPRLKGNKDKYQISCKVFRIDEDRIQRSGSDNETFIQCQKAFITTAFSLLSIANPRLSHWTDQELKKEKYKITIDGVSYGFFQPDLDVNMRFKFKFKNDKSEL